MPNADLGRRRRLGKMPNAELVRKGCPSKNAEGIVVNAECIFRAPKASWWMLNVDLERRRLCNKCVFQTRNNRTCHRFYFFRQKNFSPSLEKVRYMSIYMLQKSSIFIVFSRLLYELSQLVAVGAFFNLRNWILKWCVDHSRSFWTTAKART